MWVVNAANDYKQKAEAKQLYSISPNHCERNEIILGSVTKEELINVYDSRMVRVSKNAREIYESLLKSPFGKCPFCGFGHAYTLDHYLPKAKYPQFSVLPFNLVPSCSDCNLNCKRMTIATTAEEQILHPYFDHQNFIDDQWLHAKVIEKTSTSIRFWLNR
jgi:5-methylcytosine-specific restriction endonuclease McrA